MSKRLRLGTVVLFSVLLCLSVCTLSERLRASSQRAAALGATRALEASPRASDLGLENF